LGAYKARQRRSELTSKKGDKGERSKGEVTIDILRGASFLVEEGKNCARYEDHKGEE